ncbi:2-amino-4-hydroxy-6-hydroxymethyldihydropteridine diphosphokinase [Actibacterium sp. XHP0104]|uniref:2-amino-4-hydroxy-6- hydroxymethyldihydropteridine diphosphokinase n=1 Tax=Actibacterium sp. XHP0104 TaxID=2984335 RepID=UPI0021E8997C|nr:2-amino-4-hydroxy-6-hydroxymethyldihydropteridine diphosphokinase [Actibacterium sp. XHP0104]MCV2881614.1 2-amino-4-hydroxy-6-hydroxymethyldihydropteridine diphosphokinase [Actibacterium sp. XHP0104]
MPQAFDCHGFVINVFVALGGNVTSQTGGPEQTLHAALQDLDHDDLRLCAVSRYYRTPAFPAGSGPDFVNAVAGFATDLPPNQVLDRLHQVEARHGRQRAARWGSRTLDLDLLDHSGVVLPDAAGFAHWRDLPAQDQARLAPDQLILPHPRIQDRAFVLIPLADVAPDWVHPVSGHRVAQMLAALPEADKSDIRPI